MKGPISIFINQNLEDATAPVLVYPLELKYISISSALAIFEVWQYSTNDKQNKTLSRYWQAVKFISRYSNCAHYNIYSTIGNLDFRTPPRLLHMSSLCPLRPSKRTMQSISGSVCTAKQAQRALRLSWDEYCELWNTFHQTNEQTNGHLHFLSSWRSQKFLQVFSTL